MLRNLFTSIILSAVVCVAGLPAHADIIISFGMSSPNPLIVGNSGIVDVYISSGNGTDQLSFFAADILLSPVTGPAGGLIFSGVQSESQLTDPNYIFAGRSQVDITGNVVGSVLSGGDVYTGADFSDDGSAAPATGNLFPVTVPMTPTLPMKPTTLLYQLNLDALAAGTYTVDFDPLGFADFFDESLAPLTTTSIPGTITVNAASAAVPEPGTFAFLTILAVAAVMRRWLRTSDVQDIS